jgi:hypothetical protein
MRLKTLAFVLLILPVGDASAQSGRVDSRLNPQVTQATVESTICAPGWSRRVRPASGYTHHVKLDLLREFELPAEEIADFELDHRIPISLGGAPYDRANLELQPWDEAGDKDRKEVCLARAVCAGRLTLDEARDRIWRDWRHVGAECD